ncbi:MAG: J domain-containing protein [Bacteroidales bacterium]|nr:J domain-containing protein [Bacteroidales bacterium]
MPKKNLLNNFERQQKLCNLCIHARINKQKGIYCNLTNNVADFYSYCPSFKVHPARDNKINSGKINNNASIYFLGFVAFYILIILFIAGSNFSVIISYLLLVLLLYSIYLKKTHKTIPKLGKFPFVYFIIINYVLKNKPFFGDAEIAIITQQIVKLIGREGISYANEIFSSDEDLYTDIDRLIKRISEDQRKFIFSMACQVYIFNNIEDYKTTKILDEIARKINLQKEYYDKIKAKYLKKELIFQQKARNKKENNKENEEENKQGRKIYKFYSNKFYNILGISHKATDNQIKKRFKQLALIYHPDKFAGKTENEQYLASEKFKEISEAYNYIRRKRGF